MQWLRNKNRHVFLSFKKSFCTDYNAQMTSVQSCRYLSLISKHFRKLDLKKQNLFKVIFVNFYKCVPAHTKKMSRYNIRLHKEEIDRKQRKSTCCQINKKRKIVSYRTTWARKEMAKWENSKKDDRRRSESSCIFYKDTKRLSNYAASE